MGVTMSRIVQKIWVMLFLPLTANSMEMLPSDQEIIDLFVDDAITTLVSDGDQPFRFIADGGNPNAVPPNWDCSALDLFYTYSAVVAATNENTANTIVQRNAKGTFSATSINADLIGNVTGNASTATLANTATNFTGTAGNARYFGGIHNSRVLSTNTPSSLVLRDGSGNFAAGTITANITGNVTGNVSGNADSATLANTATNFTGTAGNARYFAGIHNSKVLSTNTPSSLVLRDGSGNFAAGTITANITGNVTGNASTASLAAVATTFTGTAGAAVYARQATSFTGSLIGDVTGNQGTTVVSNVGGKSAASIASTVTSVAAATSNATPNTIVQRNANGDISTREITTSTALNMTSTGAAIYINNKPILSALGDTINSNIFVGSNAGSVTLTSSRNTAIGGLTLTSNRLGSNNIAVGYGAGSSLINGNNNIYVGNGGITRESAMIRLGNSATHTGCSIAGIANVNIPKTASSVFIDSSGKLGTIVSSKRFKKDITDLADKGAAVTALRPVSFRYNNQPDEQLQYGLIAEEVAEVMPELVIYNEEKQIQSVAYHLLPVLLLQQYQKQQAMLTSYAQQISSLQQEVRALKQTT